MSAQLLEAAPLSRVQACVREAERGEGEELRLGLEYLQSVWPSLGQGALTSIQESMDLRPGLHSELWHSAAVAARAGLEPLTPVLSLNGDLGPGDARCLRGCRQLLSRRLRTAGWAASGSPLRCSLTVT